MVLKGRAGGGGGGSLWFHVEFYLGKKKHIT